MKINTTQIFELVLRYRAFLIVLLILLLGIVPLVLRESWIRAGDFPRAERYLDVARYYYNQKDFNQALDAVHQSIEFYQQPLMWHRGKLREAVQLKQAIEDSLLTKNK